MRLNLWRLIGRLELDDRGFLRYTVTFGSEKVARRVKDFAGHCARRRGQILWTGSNVWYGLSLMNAPSAVVAIALDATPRPSPETVEQLMAAMGENMEVIDDGE